MQYVTGAEDYLQPFNANDLQYASSYTISPGPPVSLEFLNAVEILMRENNLEFPQTIDAAFTFYLTLVDLFHAIM